jgi:Arc/MetJ family transcription regulator
MRTNIIINDELMREAMTYSRAGTKKALIEEALVTYIKSKEAERRRMSYEQRAAELEKKIAGLRFRRKGVDLLREDRERA